ncbi:plasmid mobilization protein [Salipiger mucosus]|uniref:Bacterial mobilisation domain-containing protein n=1 Tax=Salipiger mucosus DSM 16094 TaxID=1123237 RepID=S9RC19_9RHOB|nr:hypothetical protein [Salipiger mucosus]EPX75640.1 hypothetical protein Salmuc_04558 [Salipiger mucosus DSM 16094]
MSASERRRQTRQIGLRMTPDLYARIASEAKRRGISPTSRIREILIQQYDLDTPAPRIRSPRSRNLTPSQLAALSFAGDLGRAGNNLNQAVKRINEARKSSLLSEELFTTLHLSCDALLDLLHEIRSEMSGARDP